MRGRVLPSAIILLFTSINFVASQTPTLTPAVASAFSTPARPERVLKTCPVTKPPAEPFVPPPPYWTHHNPDQFWYGTESLWTLIGIRGVWNVHHNVLENEGV